MDIYKPFNINKPQNGILDKLNGFTMKMSASVQDFDPPPQDGNGTLIDLSSFPILSIRGTRTVQVMHHHGNGSILPWL